MTEQTCRFTQARFLDLEEGCLSPDAAVAVREHLRTCPACRQGWEHWQADDRRLREALRPVPAPGDLTGAALARIRRAGAVPAAPGRRLALRWGLAAAAAAVAALAFGAWALLGRRYQELGQVAVVEGEVVARQRGARRFAPLRAGTTVFEGDELVSRAASRVAVTLYDNSRLALQASTTVRLHHVSGDEEADACGFGLSHICLSQGEVECDLRSVRYFRAVGTPLGTAVVKGTRFRMRYVSKRRVLLEVLEGEVLFSCPMGQGKVGPGAVWAIDGPRGIPRRLEGVSWQSLAAQ